MSWITEHEKQMEKKLQSKFEDLLMYGEVQVNVNQEAANMATSILADSVTRGKTPFYRIGKLKDLIDTLDMENINLALGIINGYERNGN